MLLLKFLALGLLVASNTALADLDQICANAVNSAPAWDTDLIAYREDGKSIIETFNGSIIASTPAMIRGLIQDGLSIWALTPTQLIEFNAGGEILNTYQVEHSGNPYAGTRSMAKAGKILIITLGHEGMLGFDLEQRKIAWVNSMSDQDGGEPTAVAFDGTQAYIAAATNHENGFTGIITVNPETGAITKKIPYDVPHSGVIGIDANARMSGDTLVLNNGGWIHLISKEQIERGGKVRPRWVAHVIPQNGQVNAHYMILAGGFLVHDQEVMGCGTFTAQEEGGGLTRKSKLFHVPLPK